MKKLNKIQINSERIIKNDELLSLKGGKYENACTCLWVERYQNEYTTLGYYISPDGNCYTGCQEGYSGNKYAEGSCISK